MEKNMNKELENIMRLSNIIYGVCTPNICDEYISKVNKVIEKKWNCGFIKNDYLEKMTPLSYLESVKKIIVICVPYHKNDLILDKNETAFSSSSWGEDYHKVLKSTMDNIVNELKQLYPNEEFITLVDKHNLDERYYAYKAGIGFYGKHGMIINEKLGSNIFIGLILTSVNFLESKPNMNKCMSCNKCIKYCPGKAITEHGIDYNKCISYLTQKKDLTQEEENKIIDLVYGCDVCSKICPHNNNDYGEKNFLYDEKVKFLLDENVTLSNKQFEKIYGKYSGSWRGQKIIKRNLKLIKQNRNKLENKK